MKYLSYKDQTGEEINLNYPPTRIVSLVPSQSELLWEMGVQHNRLVGITKFCIHPDEMFRSVERVGGTKNCSIEKILRLHPDLVIGNKEENDRDTVMELKKHVPVWLSDVNDVAGAFEMIVQLDKLCEFQQDAVELVNRISLKRDLHQRFLTQYTDKKKVVYLIWKDPVMVTGNTTFIHSMLNEAGFINVAADMHRYPIMNMDQLKLLQPEVIFLSSEPFPFSEKDIYEFQLHFPRSKVMLVDGEMFSWYGLRMLHAYDYFRQLQIGLQN